MPQIKPYNRNAAVAYAQKWAFDRNPAYLDFSDYGGNCTNFVSQCLYAGSGVMNYTPVYGWYYISAYDRAPAWTSVKYLAQFLLNNSSKAVFGRLADISDMMLGDVIQLGAEDGEFYHSLIVTSIGENPSYNNIKVATNTFDAYNRRLSSYYFEEIRFIHIEGAYI